MNIKLFLVKIFPKFFMPWGELEPLTNAHKYREALELIEKFEKNNPDFKELFEKDEAWKLIKKTCFNGIFVVEYYGKASQLLTDKKFEEAKKIAIEGGLVLRPFAGSYGVSEETIINLKKEIEEKSNLGKMKIGELHEFVKRYIANIKSEDEKFFMDLYLNLSIVIPATCNAHMK